MRDKPITSREIDKVLRKFESKQVKEQKKKDLKDLQREIENLFQ